MIVRDAQCQRLGKCRSICHSVPTQRLLNIIQINSLVGFHGPQSTPTRPRRVRDEFNGIFVIRFVVEVSGPANVLFWRTLIIHCRLVCCDTP